MTKCFVYDDAPPERRPVLVAGIRTPWIKAGADLKRATSADLGVLAVRELLARAELPPADVDELIFGCVGPQATEANIARVVALRAGIPARVPAFSVHRNCASSFQAVEDAARRIVMGEGSIYVVGGTESMSAYPLLFGPRLTALFERLVQCKTFWQRARTFLSFRPSMLAPRIALVEGLTDWTCGMIMGLTAEKLANEFGITREEQDRYALDSHQKAIAAWNRGDFDDEVCEVFMPPQGAVVAKDNGPRENQSLAALAKLRPYFDRREGSVTVGNSCPVTDGAAALLLVSEREAEARGFTPLARLRCSAVAGLDPARMGLGPAYAVPAAAGALGLQCSDLDVWELNEAFAAQVIACVKALDSDVFARDELGLSSAFGAPAPEALNPRGGAVALGHPVGATGARLVLALTRQLGARGGGLGVATACVGGGQGAAQIWEAAA